MIRFLAFFFLLLSGLNTFSQATFEQGYFIDNDDLRVDCKIMVPQWNRTPTEFFYKITDSAETKMAIPASVKEFGIGTTYKLISARVKIDISSDDENNPSEMKAPDWYEQTVFLMVLVEGKASLYEYDQTTIKRYFYKTKEQPINQLIYKIYRLKDDNLEVIRTDATFRQQLWTHMNIRGSDVKSLENVDYTKSDLVRYFTEYDQKSGLPYFIQTRKKESPGFNLKITPGFNYTLFMVKNLYFTQQNFDFPAQSGFRVGIEAELVIPYTHRTVSLLLEPTYHYYNASQMSMGQEMAIRLQAIEFPIGVRYYLYFTRELRGFVNIFYIPGYMVNFNSTITLGEYSSGMSFRKCIAAGAGLAWKRLGLEFRWYTNKKILTDFQYLESKYARFSIILGYQLFRTKQK